MTKTREARIDDLLYRVLQQPEAEQRAFLEAECEDEDIRREILEALRQQEGLGDFLEDPVALPLADLTVAERGPDRNAKVELGAISGSISRIGPYQVLEQIGHGGMGRVFLAEQQTPIRRRVAVKLMKTSLVSSEAMARFLAERQAMARLSHSSVARIFDAGTTEDGHPFFVMEHVPGVPITEYCDRKELSVECRLRLFLEVCAGVQHAHLNQILHRDLKPSNVLVAEIDSHPVVKIIDFGIAKALDQPLTDEAFVTGDRILGTPAYMSPEALQGEEVGRDRVDARTDVYSIGVLLYELLAGSSPFDTKDGVASMLRQICEDDPPRLSRKISSYSLAQRSLVAESRQIEPVELSRRLSGDLDWILQKAIARDPDERYVSAAELAAELERHLRHEPVLAGPQSLRYRWGKLVRRHRLAVFAAAVALAALLLGVVGTTYGLFRARNEAQVAREARAEEERARRAAEEVSRFLIDLFEISDPGEARGREVTAEELLDRGAERIGRELGDQPLVRARLMETLGRVQLHLGFAERAIPLFEATLRTRRSELGERHLDVAESLTSLGEGYLAASRLDAAQAMLEESLALRESLVGTVAPELMGTLRHLAAVHTNRGQFREAEEFLRRALAIGELLGEAESTASLSAALGACYAYQGRMAAAERLYRQALEIYKHKRGDNHPRVASTLDSLASVLSNLGRFGEAEQIYQRSLAIHEKVLPPEHPRLRIVLSNLAYSLYHAGRYQEALAQLERSAALDADHPVPASAAVASRLTNLGLVYWKLGRLEEAEPLFHRAKSIRERILDPAHPHHATSIFGLANVYRDQGRLEEAEALYREALKIRQKALPPGHRERVEVAKEYATLLRLTGRADAAASLEEGGG